MKSLTVLVAMLVSLTACGSTSSSSSAPAAPTPSATVQLSTPAPTTWDMATARSEYLTMVAAINGDISAFNSVPNTVAAETALCRKAAVDDDAFARAVAAGNWPPKVAGIASDLVSTLADEEQIFTVCGSETSLDAIQADAQRLATAGAAGKAELFRISLGLPAAKG